MSTPGVNTRTGNTTEPTPLFVKVNEVKAGEMRMGFATAFEAICFLPASVEVESIKPAGEGVARAGPRVKPDSVIVNAPAAVPTAPAISRMRAELVESEFEAVIDKLLHAPAPNEGAGLAPK